MQIEAASPTARRSPDRTSSRDVRRSGPGLLALLLAALSPGGAAAQEAAPSPTVQTAPARRSYRRPLDTEGLLTAWLGSGLAERIELGRTAGGREVFGLQLGGPGPTALAERTTVFLVGGLDGVSLAGCEAVLAIVSDLLEHPESLPPNVTFLAVPWANPDGLIRTFEHGGSSGRNDRRVDDDGDGVADEDGPDDMDGDELILDLLVQDPGGDWVLCSDKRFLRHAGPGEAPRYLRQSEGRDDDGDGLFNEDGPGGVDLDHNFPVGWSGPWSGFDAGPWPLSELETRALAELVLARRTAVLALLQGNHGRLVGPGGLRAGGPSLLQEDRGAYARLAQELRAAGRGSRGWLPLHEAHGGDHPGSALDWAYLALGTLSFELAPWGPEVDEGGEAGGGASREAGSDTQGVGGAEDLSARARAWAAWLDDTRGGIGFVDWQPVELARGVQGLLGGWEPRTFLNPPEDVLPRALEGLPGFFRRVASGLPRLEVELQERDREVGSPVCRLGIRVHNLGSFPSGMGPPGAGELVCRLKLGEGMQLVAGELEHRLGQLPGGGVTELIEWLILAPEGALFAVEVESPWCAPDRREIRL